MRKRNCKKATAALMAAALSTALLAGCGSTAPVDSTPESVAVSEAAPAQSTEEGDADEMAARNCADFLISVVPWGSRQLRELKRDERIVRRIGDPPAPGFHRTG